MPDQDLTTSVPQRTTVVALDLEGTLVSNAVSVFPRPGLYEFLQEVLRLANTVVLFTSVSEARAREVVELLTAEGSAPGWFATIPILTTHSGVKDLARVADVETARVLLVDDRHDVLPPDQQDCLIHITEYEPPYAPDDAELAVVLRMVKARGA